ncbi:peroxiredoxin q [Moniliophthora roreri]|uniref:thioredoxin-dependent peroxiredoxin n=1 Tax=Moniliophthora roreri TaxID=221103 RepID=A0A0W0FWH1_MONRR|nr:peroxiredoxin q [Moniliophthora roreri]
MSSEPAADVVPQVANGEAEVKTAEPTTEAPAETINETANELTNEPTSEASSAPAARRSSRISAQPAKEPAKPKKAAAAGKNAKKRTADEAQEENGEATEQKNGTTKKTKTVIPDIPSINLGDPLPNLTLKNEKDEDVDVSKLATEKGVVIFLVPKADTPGCTTQACGFRDIYAEFTTLGYDVYCLSADTTNAQNKWQTKKNLGYSLLSDPKRVFISALGAADKNKTKRSHFIFEKGTGKLVDIKNPVKPADSPNLALEFIKQHSPNTAGPATEASDAAPAEALAAADGAADKIEAAEPAAMETE